MTATGNDGAPAAKERLREQMRARRRAWVAVATAEERDRRADSLAELVVSDPVVQRACNDGRVITCFASMPGEPPTDLLLDRLAAAGAEVLLPQVAADRVLHWARYDGVQALRAAPLSTREPIGPPIATSPAGLLALAPAVLLIPALAIDRSGVRLGHGGGYYDRVLEALPSSADGAPELIALIGPDELLDADAIPCESHDRRVNRWILG